MLIKIENGVPTGFPILEDNFRQLYPAVVFPPVLTNEIVEPYGFAMYDFSQVPEAQWDEDLVEGAPTKDQYGIWRQRWLLVKVSDEVVQVRLAQKRAEFMQKVDLDVDRIYSGTTGNRATEYQLAESDAVAFAAAGFAGPVPVTVQDWADITGWTPQQAAEDVLAAANAWRAAQLSLRKQRLMVKDQLRKLSDFQAMTTVMAQWAAYVIGIRSALELGQ